MLPFRKDKLTTPDSVPGPVGASSSSSSSASTTAGSIGRRLLRRKPSIVALRSSDESDSGSVSASASVAPSVVPNTASTTSTFSDRLESLEDSSSSSDCAHLSSHRASPPPSAPSSFFPRRRRERRGSEPALLPKQAWDNGGGGGTGFAAGAGGGGGVVIIDSAGDTGSTRIGLPGFSERPPSLAATGGPAVRTGHPFITLDPGSVYGYDLTPAPSYPTALSPPPRPKSRQGQGQGQGEPAPVACPTVHAQQTQAQTYSAQSSTAMNSSSAPPACPASASSTDPDVTGTPRKRINAEWLARKPSSRRDYSPAMVHTRTHARNNSSSLSSSTGRPSTPARTADEPRLDSPQEGFQVEAVCSRTDEGDLKWEVVIRRRPTPTPVPTSTSISPLALSTNPIMTSVPSTSTSINLSLSLDQPTGKLAFISIPDTFQPGTSTPRRPRPLTSSNSAPSSASKPTTPPPAPNPNVSPTPQTPPGSSTNGSASGTDSLSNSRVTHRDRITENSLWPSPSQAGRQSPGMPLSSPRRGEETWTPRRMRFVTAGELSGGLYAPGTTGTIEALSEELSAVSMASVSGTLAPAPALTFDPSLSESSSSSTATPTTVTTTTLERSAASSGSRTSSSEGRRQATVLWPSLEEDRSARVARWEGVKI